MTEEEKKQLVLDETIKEMNRKVNELKLINQKPLSRDVRLTINNLIFEFETRLENLRSLYHSNFNYDVIKEKVSKIEASANELHEDFLKKINEIRDNQKNNEKLSDIKDKLENIGDSINDRVDSYIYSLRTSKKYNDVCDEVKSKVDSFNKQTKLLDKLEDTKEKTSEYGKKVTKIIKEKINKG